MRKYNRSYSYRPESFGDFLGMSALAIGVAAVVSTPLVAGDYFSKKGTIKNLLTEEMGYKVKTLDSVELTSEQLDDTKKYYVTLGGKLVEAVDGKDTWEETYSIGEKEFFNLNEKKKNDEKSTYKLYLDTCKYLQEKVFPYTEPVLYSQQDVLNGLTCVPDYNHAWSDSDCIM